MLSIQRSKVVIGNISSRNLDFTKKPIKKIATIMAETKVMTQAGFLLSTHIKKVLGVTLGGQSMSKDLMRNTKSQPRDRKKRVRRINKASRTKAKDLVGSKMFKGIVLRKGRLEKIGMEVTITPKVLSKSTPNVPSKL